MGVSCFLKTVFLFTFGIFLQSNLHYDKNNNLSWYQLLSEFVKNAFWPIFGEFEIFKSFNCSSDSFYECTNKAGSVSSYILLMVYMILANILLINLLIALFKYVNITFKF